MFEEIGKRITTRIDLDTCPESNSVRHAGKSIEVLTLDGNKKQRLTGPFSVQIITAIGDHRSFPTINIAFESRTPAELKVATLEI